MKAWILRLATAALVAGSFSAHAQIQGYWADGSGKPLMDSRGQCIRSGAWPASSPQPGCDPMPKPAPKPAVPPPVPPDRVVLLPDADGKVGALIVQSSQGQVLIDKAYASVAATPEGGLTRGVEDPQAISQRYGTTLGAIPAPPVSFVLRFAPGSSTRLSADAAAVLERIKLALASRAIPEVEVIGHTDTVGNQEANDLLSVKRAETVKGFLIAAGIPEKSIEISGRGEREPLVPTADEVAEAQNRRVEVNVR